MEDVPTIATPLEEMLSFYNDHPVEFMAAYKLRSTPDIYRKLMSLACEKCLDMAAEAAKLEITRSEEGAHLGEEYTAYFDGTLTGSSTTVRVSKQSILALKSLFV